MHDVVSQVRKELKLWCQFLNSQYDFSKSKECGHWCGSNYRHSKKERINVFIWCKEAGLRVTRIIQRNVVTVKGTTSHYWSQWKHAARAVSDYIVFNNAIDYWCPQITLTFVMKADWLSSVCPFFYIPIKCLHVCCVLLVYSFHIQHYSWSYTLCVI